MVKSANMNGLLDSDSDSLSSCQHRVKARLHEIMQKDAEFCEEDYEKVKHLHGLGAPCGLRYKVCWCVSSSFVSFRTAVVKTA